MEIHRNSSNRVTKGLITQAEIQVFHFDGPVGPDLTLHTTADGVTPVEVVTARIEKVRVNVVAGRVIDTDGAAGAVQQPATMAIQRDANPAPESRIKITVGLTVDT